MLQILYKQEFLQNKYLKWYQNIINISLSQKRVKKKNKDEGYVYYEMHHILPKKLFPEFSNFKENPWNKVLLTPREHYICHLLLTKFQKNEYRKQQMKHAMMWFVGDPDIKINSTIFQKLKEERSANTSGENNHFFGQKHTTETRQKLSMQRRGAVRKPHSEETKRKISESQKGKTIKSESIQKMISTRKENGTYGMRTFLGRKHSEETKRKNREKHLNKKASEETKQKMSEKRIGTKFIHKDQNIKRVHKDDLNYWFDLGWELGIKHHVHNES